MATAYNGPVTETFSYSATGQRPGEATSTCTCGTSTVDSYYSDDWQVLEEDTKNSCGVFTTTNQYVWGLGYIDDLVLRDDNSGSGNLGITSSGLGRRIYAQQEANYNVTALTDTSGNVLERFDYDAYGAATVLNASTWATRSDG